MVADVGLGDIIWGLVVFFFMLIYLMMLFSVIVDLFRDRKLSGAGKCLWALFLLIFPLISVAVYLIVRGAGMADRAITEARSDEAQLQTSIRGVSGISAVDQIARAKDLLDSGAIDDAEFQRLKQAALA